MTVDVGRIAALARHARASGVSASPLAFAQQCGVNPDPIQTQALTTASKRLVMCCSRQWGKSTIAAVKSLHTALHSKDPALVILISPSERQSRELLRKCRGFVDRLEISPRKANESTIEFANGSRIVSLPSSGDTIRGYSGPALIVEDEAAFVDDELHDAVLPMLAVSRGALWLMSSPNGKHGHFYEIWSVSPDWEKVRVRAADNPRIDRAWLAQARADLERRGRSDLYRQEYEGEFIDGAAGRVYEFRDDVNFVDKLPEGDWHYVLGVDPGVVDPTGYAVIAWRDHDPIAYIAESYKTENTTPDDMSKEIKRLDAIYHFESMVCDQGGLGKGFAAHALQFYSLPLKAAEKNDKLGYIGMMNGALRSAHLKVVRPRCEQLIEEWRALSWSLSSDGSLKAVENPSQANHSADASLYSWRKALAYLQQPTEPPKDPMVQMHEDIEEQWRRDAEQNMKRQSAEWWDDGQGDSEWDG